MSVLSSKERLVLLALQADPSGLTHSQLTAVTSLGWEEVEQCVQRLETLGRAYHMVEAPYTYCCAKSFPDQPTFSQWEEWLAVFCQAYPQFEHRDRQGTTYACCGVVLLTALVGGTRNPELISQVTTLPVEFVRFVVAIANSRNIWNLESMFGLQQRLCREDLDVGEVETALHWVKENLWDFCWTPAVESRLHELRKGRQIGGRTDSWTATEDVDCLE